ncbi:MAG: TatD family hydrolase [Acidobacteriota bacterium]|nr:TatD family hydrolase [Acidobacteriota bacterium]
MTLVDSHCHLDSKEFDGDREETIARAMEAGVERMLSIGTGGGPPDLEAGIRLADGHAAIFATVGVHPHDAGKADGEIYRRLRDLLAHPKVLAMGEMGLDYHYDFWPREVQQAAFIEQMEIAAEAGKPIVIHTREAWADTLALLEQYWAPHGIGGIMHCFSGGPEEARRSLEMGFYLSFGGVVTFPKSVDVQRVAREAPADRILVETDAPYLAPVPKRGKRNEPAFVAHTVKKLAELRGEPEAHIAAVTTENFARLTGAMAGGRIG